MLDGSVSSLEVASVAISSTRSWWLGRQDDGAPLFLQNPPGQDADENKATLGGAHWREVTPIEFYSVLVAHLKASPDPDDAYLESMEETLEQWERAGKG
jgi:hypothetical protein